MYSSQKTTLTHSNSAKNISFCLINPENMKYAHNSMLTVLEPEFKVK